jgi:hypothetical protein
MDTRAPNVEHAESFLQEAVFRARERQTATVELRRGAQNGAGNCGLGEKAGQALELSPRGKDLLARLWPAGLDEAQRARVGDLVADWIGEQDKLDRKRNHFIKAFRLEHGFDRTKYSGELSRAFESGVGAINVEETERKRAAAQRLISTD